MIVPEHALIWYYQWANSLLCCHYYFQLWCVVQLWPSHYCPACKKTNKNGWWVGNCHVSCSKGQLVKKICQHIQAGAWGSQQLGSDCHDPSSLRKSSHTFFFGTGLTSLGSRMTLCILGWQWDFGAELVGLNEGVSPFDSLIWNQFVHVFSCINLLYHQKHYKSIVGEFEFNEVIKHKRFTCWVLYVMWYYATLWIVIMDLLTCFTPAWKLFLPSGIK